MARGVLGFVLAAGFFAAAGSLSPVIAAERICSVTESGGGKAAREKLIERARHLCQPGDIISVVHPEVMGGTLPTYLCDFSKHILTLYPNTLYCVFSGVRGTVGP